MSEHIETAPPLFRQAEETIRLNVESGLLPPGAVLLESALADALGMSRAPVRRALDMLAAEGLLGRFAGRGYLVGAQGRTETKPRRIDIRALDLKRPAAQDGANLPNWTRIHDAVEAELSRCRIFGPYRVVENLLANQYGTSRTVARDVLGRLQERGVVTKNAASRWVVLPLTAQAIRERFELRRILEVAALRSTAPHLDKPALRALAGRMARSARPEAAMGQAEDWLVISNAFADLAILPTPNAALREYIFANRKILETSHRALFALGLPGDTTSAGELRIIAELLLADSVSGAAEMLETHLHKLLARTIAQLKILSVVPPPEDLPAYVAPE